MRNDYERLIEAAYVETRTSWFARCLAACMARRLKERDRRTENNALRVPAQFSAAQVRRMGELVRDEAREFTLLGAIGASGLAFVLLCVGDDFPVWATRLAGLIGVGVAWMVRSLRLWMNERAEAFERAAVMRETTGDDEAHLNSQPTDVVSKARG